MSSGLFKKCGLPSPPPTSRAHAHQAHSAAAAADRARRSLTHGACPRSFTLDENVSTQSKVKSSVMRGIVRSIDKEYPCLSNGTLEQLLPKKEITVAKWCRPASARPHPTNQPDRADLTPAAAAAQPRAPERGAAGLDTAVLQRARRALLSDAEAAAHV